LLRGRAQFLDESFRKMKVKLIKAPADSLASGGEGFGVYDLIFDYYKKIWYNEIKK
jgi:hypothetical protein